MTTTTKETSTLAYTVTVRLLILITPGYQSLTCIPTFQCDIIFLGVIVYQPLSVGIFRRFTQHTLSSRVLYLTPLPSSLNPKIQDSMELIQLRTSGHWAFCSIHF
jgi:hypothetical protein